MKIATVFNNLARGQVDHDLNARSDLPIFTNGVERMLNFYSNFIFRKMINYSC